MNSPTSIDFAELSPHDAKRRYHNWLNEAANLELLNTMDDDAMVNWMLGFQQVREHLLTWGWRTFVPSEFRANFRFIRFGSAARSEDLPRSDMDYALLALQDVRLEDVQEPLLDFVRNMSQFGFPPCLGNVMGTNPRWLGTIDKWKRDIDSYFSFPDWKNARYLFMMVDSKPLDGTASEWDEVARAVVNGIRSSSFICWQMAHLGIHKTVAIDVFGRTKTKQSEADRVFEIKDGLLSPMIHSIRLLAIRAGIADLPTLDRLDKLIGQELLPRDFAHAIRSALIFGWRIRAMQHVRVMSGASEDDDAVRWANISQDDEARLVIHLRTAKALEQRVHRMFPRKR